MESETNQNTRLFYFMIMLHLGAVTSISPCDFQLDENPCQVYLSYQGELIPNDCKGNIVIEHKSQNLNKFPDNICDFPGITQIIFSGNLILDIPDLSCLTNLAYLDLSSNKITTLRKASLMWNRNLRFVDLSFNSITHVEVGVLESMAFFWMSLRGNSITSLDVTDLILSRTFCMIDVAYNKIESIVNNNNWTVDVNHVYGMGVYNGTYNRLKNLPDWKNIGFPNLRLLGKIIFRSFDIRNNPISCDCFSAQPLTYFKPLLTTIDRDFFNIRCESPSALRGRQMRSFGEGDSIRQLICNHTGVSLCPRRCTCVTEPRYSKSEIAKVDLVTIIRCSNSLLHRLPHVLPESDEVQFHFTGTSIEKVTPEHYLSSVTVLNFLFMPRFEKTAISNLISLKELYVPRPGQVSGIPRELATFHPCVFLQKEDFVMNCTCSLQWMFEWLKSMRDGECQKPFKFKCLSNNNGTESALTYLPRIDCSDNSTNSVYGMLTSMSLATLSSVLLMVIVWKRRCEIKMILREAGIRKLLRRRETLDQDCVVFISFDGDNREIRSFILKRLEPFLVTKGFHVFVPSRDLTLGSVRSEEVAWQISVSRYYITFLSVCYVNDDVFETRNEWRCIWNSYLSDNRKQLVVLNYDLLKVSDITCNKMKAVLRAGNVVDFSDGENVIFSKISKVFNLS